MKKFLFIFVVYFMFSSCTRGVDAPEWSYEPFIFTAYGCGYDELEDRFIYPPKLAWGNFPEELSGFEDYQIPEDILSTLSTESLAEICLQIPYVGVWVDYNQFDMGFKRFKNEFNSFRELFERKGVSDVLLKLYQDRLRNIAFTCGDVDRDRAFFLLSIELLEILLGFDYHQDDMNSKKVLQTLTVGYEVYGKYPRYPDSGGNVVSRPENFFARAQKIIHISPQSIEKFPDKEKNRVFQNGGLTDQETIDLINELSYQLIK